MYVTLPASQKSELWVSDIDRGSKVRLATGESLGTGGWAPDNFHVSFVETGDGTDKKAYVIGADGSGLRQLPPMGGVAFSAAWGSNNKSIYLSSVERGQPILTIWRWNLGNSNPEKLANKCGFVTDADPGGQYLLGALSGGEGTGIYEIAIFDRKCTLLLPGVVTQAALFAPDGKSLLYAVASHSGATIYRQTWREGKLIGAPKVALKLPFTFPMVAYHGTAYDFSRDLSTIVYARPGGHADLYLLSQK